MDPRCFYYEPLAQFKRIYYKDLLTAEHLIPKQIHIKKLRFPDGGEDDEANFWGYEFNKDSVSYLISSTDDNGEEIDIGKMLPILPQDPMKVAKPSGEVYFWIRRPVSVRFKPEQNHTPKQFIDTLSCFNHENPTHYKLMWMMALSQMWDRSYYRLSTNPGFMKDGVVDICASLFGGCGTVESPTIAKLEDRASVLKWLVVNEVVDISKGDWDIIQQFLLASAAHKNEVTKHSRAYQNVKEIIDMSMFSLSLYYNDIDCYPDPNKYFDMVSKKAVKDRFPAFRFWGKVTQDFNIMRHVNIEEFVKQHLDYYKKLLFSYTYYKDNYHKHLHKWNTGRLMSLDGRHATNLGRLLKVVDFYCDTQEEFDGWMDVINKSLLDYHDMIEHIKIVERFKKQKGDELYIKEYKTLNTIRTFTEKNKHLVNVLEGKKVIKDQKVWDDYVNDEEDIL